MMNLRTWLMALATLATLMPLALWAADDALDRYAAVAAVELHSSDGLQRLALPLAVLQASRSAGYADVRLFDARGEPVPLAWALPPPQAPRDERSEAVPRFGWPAGPSAAPAGTQVQINTAGAVVRIDGPRPAASAGAQPPAMWLLDLSALAGRGERITRLTLDWPAREGGLVSGVNIEGSDDARTWRPVTRASLLDLARSGAPTLKHVDWPAAAGLPRYLRLGFDLPLALTRSDVLLSRAAAPPPMASQQVRFMAAAAGPGEPQPWTLDLQGQVPLARLRVHLPQTNTVLPLKLQQRDEPGLPWRTVTTLVAWRLTRSGDDLQAPAAAFEARPARYWQLVPDVRDTGWKAATLDATVEWMPPQIVFAARGVPAAGGPSPGLRLAVGRGGPGAWPLELASLIPGYEPGAEHRLPAASLAPLTAQTVAPRGLAQRLLEASPADRQRWTLWAVLVLAVLGLGLLAWRLTRELRQAGRA